MASPFTLKLVERLRQRPDGRGSYKLRTILEGYGYSRLNAEVVPFIREDLGAAGITIALSVDSPKTLDERVLLTSAPSAATAIDTTAAFSPVFKTAAAPVPAPETAVMPASASVLAAGAPAVASPVVLLPESLPIHAAYLSRLVTSLMRHREWSGRRRFG